MPSPTTKIIVLHPDLRVLGGAERYAQSLIDTLIDQRGDVTIRDIHTCFGPLGPLIARMIHRFTLLKYALVCLWYRLAQPTHQICISTFAHPPKTSAQTMCVLHAPDILSGQLQDLLNNQTPTTRLRRSYIKFCRWLIQPQFAQRAIINSPWTWERLAPQITATATLIAPPIPSPKRRATIPTDPRFIMIGRITQSKRPEQAIHICDDLRAHHPNLTLTMIGTGQGRYAQRIHRLAQHRPWLSLVAASEKDKDLLLKDARFGLHFAQNEHFGIAICEMISAGVIPFVHRSGSGPDLVPLPQFQFTAPDDLRAKISAALSLSDAQYNHTLNTLQSGALYQKALNHRTDLDAFFRAARD